MTFNKLGGIYYNETTEINKIDYGGSIPCFIGRTINPEYLKTQTVEADSTANPPVEAVTYSSLKTQAETGRKINQLQMFTNFEQVNRSVENGGLGDYVICYFKIKEALENILKTHKEFIKKVEK